MERSKVVKQLIHSSLRRRNTAVSRSCSAQPWLASLILGRRLPKKLRHWLATATLLLALGRSPTSTHAATITVVDSEVAIEANGRCSLIEALHNANDTADGNVHADCDPGNPTGADTIQLPENGTFTLTTADNEQYEPTGLPLVSSNIIISGNGATISRDADAPPFRLLAINGEGALTLDRLALSGGTAERGGALYNHGTLSLSNSILSGNTAERGGAIYNNYGMLTIETSTLDGNAADEGGGLYSSGGMVTINGSTISGNTAAVRGGGIFVAAERVLLGNSTISGNTAVYRGGGLYNRGIVTLTNTTVTANRADQQEGGGLFNDGTTIFIRSLLSGNFAATSATSPELYNAYAGSLIANNYNIFGYSDDPGGNFQPGQIDLVPVQPLDAILNPNLADNGGPTYTHALPPGSPAVDLAPSEECDFAPTNGRDQRNAPRNHNGDATPSANECDSAPSSYSPMRGLSSSPQ